MSVESLRLKNEAGSLILTARQILDKAAAEDRKMSEDETRQFDEAHADSIENLERAEAMEKQERAEAGAPDGQGSGVAGERDIGEPGTPKETRREATPEYHEASMAYIRHGESTLTHEQRALLQSDNDPGFGFATASEKMVSGILQTADDLLVIRQLATTHQVDINESLGVIQADGDITPFTYGGAELKETEEDTGLGVGKRELKPRRMNGKVVKISRTLLESDKIDVEGYINTRVAYALAAGQEIGFMTGNGAEEPLGLFTASDNGITTSQDVTTDMATDNFTSDALREVQGTLPSIYQGAAQWLFHRTALTKISKLKLGDQQYIWQPGLQVGAPSLILGKPYVLGDKVPNTFSSSLYVGMYADFSWFWIVDALNMTVQRLVELYARNNQIGLQWNNIANDGQAVIAEAFVRIKTASG